MKPQVYKFRSECACDAPLFLAAVKAVDPNAVCTPICNAWGTREEELGGTVETTLTLEQLCDVAYSCADCHVIMDTIQPIADYTGGRLGRFAYLRCWDQILPRASSPAGK